MIACVAPFVITYSTTTIDASGVTHREPSAIVGGVVAIVFAGCVLAALRRTAPAQRSFRGLSCVILAAVGFVQVGRGLGTHRPSRVGAAHDGAAHDDERPHTPRPAPPPYVPPPLARALDRWEQHDLDTFLAERHPRYRVANARRAFGRLDGWIVEVVGECHDVTRVSHLGVEEWQLVVHCARGSVTIATTLAKDQGTLKVGEWHVEVHPESDASPFAEQAVPAEVALTALGALVAGDVPTAIDSFTPDLDVEFDEAAAARIAAFCAGLGEIRGMKVVTDAPCDPEGRHGARCVDVSIDSAAGAAKAHLRLSRPFYRWLVDAFTIDPPV